jgi:lysine 2,3-aminomutase
MKNNYITTIKQLEEYISFTDSEKNKIQKVIDSHPIRINKDYMDLINWNDPNNDPIYKMVIPSIEENRLEGSFDTSGEQENTKLQGLQHKYPQTALVLTTNSCASYCRYCFRKRLVGLSVDEIVKDWDSIVKYITEHKEITNVLLSGGDPFTLPTNRIKYILEKISDIDHLDFIRFGSRILVVYPDKILKNNELINILKAYSSKKKIYITTQFNHPKEITPKTIGAIEKLSDAQIIVNNQTGLLKGVNDDPAVMAELQSKLIKINVIPYYIFQCRPVKKIKNIFQVPLQQGYHIIEQTKSMLDGVSKRFKFIMSHETGKIEIIGLIEDKMYFKYHHPKDKSQIGKIFHKKMNIDDCWLDL